jgi:TonB family protein
VNEAVDRLIAERGRMERGLPVTMLASLFGHLMLVASAIVLPRLLPHEPPLRVADGFAVLLPRGGGGSPTAQAPPAEGPAPQPLPAASAAPPPPKVLKPPVEAPRPRALPLPDSRRVARNRPEPPVPPGRASASPSSRPAPAASGGVPGGTGTSSAFAGVLIGPPGPGVPDGTDAGGDWYIAGVTQKIWMIWNQQIKAGFSRPIGVTFTIQPNGTVTDVRVSQPSGAALLDMAAQRAVLNAAPFGPLPREYGGNPRTIQALFRPTS